MPTTTTKVNATNAYATRWTQGDATFELSAIKGGHNLTLGMLPAGSSQWTTCSVADPERFTGGNAVNTQAGFDAIVERYLSA